MQKCHESFLLGTKNPSQIELKTQIIELIQRED